MSAISTQLAHGIKATTTTAGTGSVTLASLASFMLPLARFAVGSLMSYSIQDGNNREWGIGTVQAGNVLDRTTITGTLVAGTYTEGGTAMTLSGGQCIVECSEHEGSDLSGVTEFYSLKSGFPATGLANKLYVDKSTGLIWRWDTVTSTYVGVPFSTDASGNAVLVGPDGDIPLRLLQGRTEYPAFHNRRPLQHTLIPFGTALINDKWVTGTTVAVAVDTVETFNGKPSTKCTVAPGGTSPNLDVGVSAATITLDSEAQLALTRGVFIAVKTDGANTASSATLYVGDATYANMYTFGLEKLGEYDGWAMFGKLNVGASSTTGTPNLAAAVRAKVRVVCSANVVAGDVWIAPAYVTPQPKPTVVFTVDDGYDECTWLAAEAAKRGIPISFGIAKDYIGTAGFLTESAMLAIANHPSGLFELTNHSTVNTNYSVAGLATYKASVDACRDYLIGLGCDANAARCHQYVQGINDQTLIDVLQADGYLSAREVGSANRRTETLPIAIEGAANDHLFKIPATCNLDSGYSLSTVQGYITNAAQLGTAFIMGHKFEATAGAITWVAGYDDTNGVLNLLDWLAYQRDVNGWRLLKWSQWYQEVRSGSEYDAVIA